MLVLNKNSALGVETHLYAMSHTPLYGTQAELHHMSTLIETHTQSIFCIAVANNNNNNNNIYFTLYVHESLDR